MTKPPSKRAEDRSNVFLSAVLESGSQTFAVRIRNISPGGALIDGPNIPAALTKVVLMRGSLSAVGQVAWREADQAGISFDQAVKTSVWVAKVGHLGQQRVDKIVAAIKRSDPLPRSSLPDDEESLLKLSVTLEEICERLAAVPDLSETLGEELMKLDAVAQSLRRISTRGT